MEDITKKLTIVSNLRFFYVMYIPIIANNMLSSALKSGFFTSFIKIISSGTLTVICCLLIFFRCKYIYVFYKSSNQLLDYYYVNNTKVYKNKFKEFKISVITTLLVVINIIILFLHKDDMHIMKYIEGFFCFYLILSFLRHLKKESKGFLEKKITSLLMLVFEPLFSFLLFLQIIGYADEIIENFTNSILSFLMTNFNIHNGNLVHSLEILITTVLFTTLFFFFFVIYIFIFQPPLNLNSYINALNLLNAVVVVVNLANMAVNILEFNKIHIEGISIYIATISFPILTIILVGKIFLEQQKRRREKVAKKIFIKIHHLFIDSRNSPNCQNNIMLDLKKCCLYGGDNYILLFYNNPKTVNLIKGLEF
ncbi:hypothetical protein [Bacillus velezensis]|uniref:hypothetical protein n=1 Tax=Bacillus velezensis TaxID=492670 RepID=UPI003862493A